MRRGGAARAGARGGEERGGERELKEGRSEERKELGEAGRRGGEE